MKSGGYGPDTHTAIILSCFFTGAPVLELKLKALIMDTIHNIEVVEMLIDSRIPGKDDWKWQKQLRY